MERPSLFGTMHTFARNREAGIRFCNGAITSTNQYCCDDGSSGVGSFECCKDQSSIFVINPIATVLAQMPARQQSSTSSTSSFSTTTTSSSSSASTATASTTLVSAPSQSTSETPPPTSTQTDDGKSTNTAAIGAGVGVPVGAIALGLIAFLAWRHRKKNTRKGGRLVDDMDGGYTPADNTASPAQELHRVNPVAVATRDRKSFEGGLEYNGPLPSTRELEEGREYDGSSPPIRELDGTSAVHELEGSGAQKWL